MSALNTPDLVVIGAPKGGTTSLAAWLAEHPGMAMSGTKELEYLDFHFERGPEWYAGQLPVSDGVRKIGEATPGYLAHPLAPQRAAATMPRARFVAVLREPVARAWSHYQFLRWLGVEHRSWEASLKRAEKGLGPADYLGIGRYAEHLARWDAAVGADRVLVMLFDDFVKEPTRAFQTVCRFTGIADDVLPASTDSVNTTRRPKNLPLQLALHKTGLSRRRYGRELHAWNLQGRPCAKLDPQRADELREQFSAANAQLEQRLGPPLPASWFSAAGQARRSPAVVDLAANEHSLHAATESTSSQ